MAGSITGESPQTLSFENQASTLSTSFSEYITDVQFVAHHSFNQLTSQPLIN